jgi:hypothetical protein
VLDAGKRFIKSTEILLRIRKVCFIAQWHVEEPKKKRFAHNAKNLLFARVVELKNTIIVQQNANCFLNMRIKAARENPRMLYIRRTKKNALGKNIINGLAINIPTYKGAHGQWNGEK